MKDPLKESLLIATQKLNEFVAARAEIDKQRAAIDAQIIQWKQLTDSLRTVCTDEDEEDPSDVEVSAFVEGKPGKQTVKFTDGVRMVFKRNQNTILTAPEIRNGLLNLGFDFSKYSQPLTPIHNCLKRLEEQGEVKPEKTKDGQIIGYKWISSIERALAEDTIATVEGLAMSARTGMIVATQRAAEQAATAMKEIERQLRATSTVRNDLPKTPGEAKERMKRFSHARTVPPGSEEEK